MATEEPRPTGMKLTAIRISHEGWDTIEAEAKKRKISAAEFIRESVFMRLGRLQVEHDFQAALESEFHGIEDRIVERILHVLGQHLHGAEEDRSGAPLHPSAQSQRTSAQSPVSTRTEREYE